MLLSYSDFFNRVLKLALRQGLDTCFGELKVNCLVDASADVSGK